MKRALRLGALLLPILPGCVGLVFDEQEVRLRFDAERDRLDALLVYRGLYLNEDRSFLENGPALAKKQLDRILEGHRSFALVLPFFCDFDDPEKSKEGVGTPLVALLKESVVVENGRFFRDAKGRLSWWQCARLGRLTPFLALANDAIRSALADGKEGCDFRKGLRLTDEESGRLLERAIGAKEPFLLRRGSALAFRFPASLEGHRRMVRGFLDDFREEAVKATREEEAALAAEGTGEAAAPSRPSGPALSEFEFGFRFWSSLELSFVRTGDWTEVVLGNPERVEQVLLAPRQGGYEDNLAPLLKEGNVSVHMDVTDATIERAFREFAAR